MEALKARVRLIEHLRREIKDQRVLEVMGRIPREFFVPSYSQALAYEDVPLPIEMGQTISQPFIVALMTEALELTGTEKVLEVGTGSGYQAAILAELACWVVTVERLAPLAEAAEERLRQMGYRNIEVHLAGKTIGWPPGAPYQAIIVTAGAPVIPEGLVEQLDEGGRLVTPVGSRYEQELLKVMKKGGQRIVTNLGLCRFVPLIGESAWGEED